ncbi:antitoxin [Mumia quercus]|uniref:antitoxin n=1 Tax=Mumia quercus TaxID=2976125 RepID=UPI0021D07691|nr:antitoxin [Mumia quercus]
MGAFDKLQDGAEDLKDKAQAFLQEHGDKIDSGIDKASDFVEDKTGGKVNLDKAADVLKDGIDKLDGEPTS